MPTPAVVADRAERRGDERAHEAHDLARAGVVAVVPDVPDHGVPDEVQRGERDGVQQREPPAAHEQHRDADRDDHRDADAGAHERREPAPASPKTSRRSNGAVVRREQEVTSPNTSEPTSVIWNGNTMFW